MSYNLDSAMFKLTFTDGTFITMLNSSSGAPTYSAGEYTMVLPNFYFGDIDGTSYEVTKYDRNGNKYVFSDLGVKINDDIDFRRTGNKMFLSYDPTTNTITCSYVYPAPEGLPYLTRSDRAVQGVCYNGDTSGTPFSSLSDAIAEGQTFYSDLGYGFYNVNNIKPRNNHIAHTLHIYAGYKYEYDMGTYVYKTGGQAVHDTLDVKNLIDDFSPIPEPEHNDPYIPGGNSGPGGGEGDFDDTSDAIDFPSLPTLSATDTGFITLFNPSTAQLQALSNYMWSSGFDLATFKKLFADPMDCILGLSIVPVAVPDGSTKTVQVGNISTGVSMTVASSQYVEVDCGTLNVNEYWGAYLDYDPYTKAEIYLPYVGAHPIAVDDIMDKAVHVKYHIDILSGACTAFVKCGDSVLYEFIGQCSSSIPISGNDWTNVINGVMSVAGAIGTMVASGGMTAPMSAAQIASTAVNSSKPNVEKSGSMSGTGGMLGVQTPYLILTRPRQALPVNQNKYMGYPSFITSQIGTLSGYTEIESIHLENVPATETELKEIETLLKQGVII